MRSRTVIVLLTLVVLVFLAFALSALLQSMNTTMNRVESYGVPAATKDDTAFVEEWSVILKPPLVHEMALIPGAKGAFFVLNNDEILRIDATNGARLAKFAAPAKSARITTDPSGAMPYLMVVSSSTKWTGAIDYVVTTDYYLHALDTTGGEVWKKRFDPKDISVLEPMVATFDGRPVIVLSASQRIICFDASGVELWNIPLWHHPWTVTEVDLSGQGRSELLVALAPKRDIVRIGVDGKQLGPWGKGDGPRRFKAMKTGGGVYGISLRQLFGGGQGVRHAVTFFDSRGTTIREIELPPDASVLSYSPIAAMDVDGSGRRNWVIALGDGTIFVFSPAGQELARHSTGFRLRSLQPVPQRDGPDLLVTATNRGLTALRPVPSRIHSPR
jgi:PQQ-like domain